MEERGASPEIKRPTASQPSIASQQTANTLDRCRPRPQPQWPEWLSPFARQGASGGGAGASGHTGHTAALLSSAGNGEQKPDGTSHAAPVHPHSQAQPRVPSAVSEQRPLGPQSVGQPRVACRQGRAEAGETAVRRCGREKDGPDSRLHTDVQHSSNTAVTRLACNCKQARAPSSIS